MFLCCTSISLHAQISISNERLIKPDEKIVYEYYAHWMKINGLNEDDTNIVVISSSFDSIHNYNHYFSYYPIKKGLDTIAIYNNGKKIYSEVYYVKSRPTSSIYFNNIRDSIVSKGELLKNPGLVYTYEPELLIPHNRITSFAASMIKKNGKEKSLTTTYSLVWVAQWDDFVEIEGKIKGSTEFLSKEETWGSHFSKEQLKKIKKMKPGEKIRSYHVGYTGESCPRGKTINLILEIK